MKLTDQHDKLTKFLENVRSSQKVVIPPEERFWSRIERGAPDQCWVFSGFCDEFGYGKIKYKGRLQSAHRVAYKIVAGVIPTGKLVLHHCDNPPCCNPQHLFLGTHQDNSDDMRAKGRDRFLPSAPKLSARQTTQIRGLYSQAATLRKQLSKISLTALARKFDVGISTIMAVTADLRAKNPNVIASNLHK